MLSETLEGVDWVGIDQWKSRVRLDTLWKDFCVYDKDKDTPISYVYFTILFRRVVRVKIKTKKIPMAFSKSNIGLAKVSFAIFPDKPTLPVPL